MTLAPTLAFTAGGRDPMAEHVDTLIKILAMVGSGALALWKIGTYFADLRADIRALGEKLGSLTERAAAVEAKVGALSERVTRLEAHEEPHR